MYVLQERTRDYYASLTQELHFCSNFNDITILLGRYNDQRERVMNKLIIWLEFFKENTGLNLSLFCVNLTSLKVEQYITKTTLKQLVFLTGGEIGSTFF